MPYRKSLLYLEIYDLQRNVYFLLYSRGEYYIFLYYILKIKKCQYFLEKNAFICLLNRGTQSQRHLVAWLSNRLTQKANR